MNPIAELLREARVKKGRVTVPLLGGQERDPHGPRQLSAVPLSLSDDTRQRGGRRSRRRQARVWRHA